MSLHNEIMNIPASSVAYWSEQNAMAYKEGHRDARHAAAELALKGDEALEAIAELAKYFTSGNAVPVERATISAKDFWRITGLTPNAIVSGLPRKGE
jgi:hypothetical protein